MENSLLEKYNSIKNELANSLACDIITMMVNLGITEYVVKEIEINSNHIYGGSYTDTVTKITSGGEIFETYNGDRDKEEKTGILNNLPIDSLEGLIGLLEKEKPKEVEVQKVRIANVHKAVIRLEIPSTVKKEKEIEYVDYVIRTMNEILKMSSFDSSPEIITSNVEDSDIEFNSETAN